MSVVFEEARSGSLEVLNKQCRVINPQIYKLENLFLYLYAVHVKDYNE